MEFSSGNHDCALLKRDYWKALWNGGKKGAEVDDDSNRKAKQK